MNSMTQNLLEIDSVFTSFDWKHRSHDPVFHLLCD